MIRRLRLRLMNEPGVCVGELGVLDTSRGVIRPWSRSRKSPTLPSQNLPNSILGGRQPAADFGLSTTTRWSAHCSKNTQDCVFYPRSPPQMISLSTGVHRKVGVILLMKPRISPTPRSVQTCCTQYYLRTGDILSDHTQAVRSDNLLSNTASTCWSLGIRLIRARES